MDFYRAVLVRLDSDEKQTLGSLSVFCGTDKVFECKTLELAWNDNKRFKSRIPEGKYLVKKRHSDTYGDHWHVQGVEGRDLILIHHGNFHRDTEGCICVGRDYFDIDQDGYRDVTSSKATMRALNNAISAIQFKLTII